MGSSQTLPGATLPGYQTITCRRTDSSRCVRIGKTHPFLSQPIQMRCRNGRAGLIRANIAVSHIICKDEHQIGRGFAVSLACAHQTNDN